MLSRLTELKHALAPAKSNYGTTFCSGKKMQKFAKMLAMITKQRTRVSHIKQTSAVKCKINATTPN
jgi:hypothetical protein